MLSLQKSAASITNDEEYFDFILDWYNFCVLIDLSYSYMFLLYRQLFTHPMSQSEKYFKIFNYINLFLDNKDKLEVSNAVDGFTLIIHQDTFSSTDLIHLG